MLGKNEHCICYLYAVVINHVIGDFPFLHNEKGHQLTNFKSFVAFLRNSEQVN